MDRNLEAGSINLMMAKSSKSGGRSERLHSLRQLKKTDTQNDVQLQCIPLVQQSILFVWVLEIYLFGRSDHQSTLELSLKEAHIRYGLYNFQYVWQFLPDAHDIE